MASFTAALKQWVIDTYQTKMGADDNYVTDAEKAALHSHANKTALDQVSGTNTGDEPAASTTVKGIVELATITEATTGTDTTRATTPAGVKAALDAKDASDMSTYEATARRVANVLPGSSFQGAFDAGTTYAVGDVVAHDGDTYLARPLLGAQTWADTTRTNHNINPTMRGNSRTGWTLGTNLTDSFPVADSVTLTATADKTVNQSLMQATTGTTSTDTQVWSAAFLVTVPSDAPNSVSVLAAIADSTAQVWRGTAVTIAPGESARVKVEGQTGRAGTTWVKAQLANAGTNPSGSVLQVSQAILEESATIGPYFDGASTGVSRSLSYWTGTADRSTSVQVTSTPTRGVDLTGWADTTRTNHNINPTMRNDSRLGWALGTNITASFPVADSVTLTLTAEKTVNTSLFIATTAIAAAEGEVWSAAFLVTVPADAPNAIMVKAGIQSIPSTVYTYGSAATIDPGETARIVVEGVTAPSGATGLKPAIANAGTNPSGSVLQVSQAILEESATVGAYFDGASTGCYWTGTADRSTSVQVTSTPTPTRGVPGVDLTGWATVDLDGGATPRIPTETDVHMVGPARGPYGAIACDRVDRTTFISGDLNGAHALQYSRDDCETWATAHTFDDTIASGTILDNGEALVATRVTGAGNTDPWKLYLSTGFRADPTTATWALVHTGTTLQGAQPTRMSYSHHENVVVVGEYGPKIGTAGATDAARYVYLSRDYGQTWTLIYDLLDNPDLASTTGIHLHGVAYDPYWDRIWVTYGDAENGTVFSDDFGATWHTAHHSGEVTGQHQVVGILPMPKCVLFGSDGPPNGVSRIDRSQGKHDGEYTMSAAYQLDESSSITILCQSVWRARRLGDDAPGVLAFTAGETGDGPWRVLVTPDGYTWHEAWTDDTDTSANAPGTAFGPTASGGIVLHAQDGRFSTNWTMWRGALPGAY